MAAAPAYRPDVDGLRAVAVLAVLVFHAFPRALPGGYVGVDVFFVISGFLISGIIFNGLQQGTFSFGDFYWRRIRRIFPALLLVLLACLAIGWWLLLPDEYRELGKHLAAGAGFAANLVLYRDGGYFSAAAEFRPLLHLWSLGVEEQYYLLWPLLLFALRRRPALMLAAIVAVAVLSFATNVVLTFEKPRAAFFLPVGRFWELLAGSLLAYFAAYRRLDSRHADLKAAAGAALIVAALALLGPSHAFPGLWALLPVAGAALLIWAGPAAWINRRVLSHRALVYVGLISYPLYLWHWPLLSFARIAHDGEPPLAWRVGLCLLSVLLACATYEWVEKKVRFSRLPSMRRFAVPGLTTAMVVAGAAGLLALQGGLAPRSAELAQVREISRAFNDWTFEGNRVIVGTTGKSVLLFGDSHMQHYWPRIDYVAERPAAPMHTIIFKTEGGCAPVPGIERKGRRCSKFVEEGLRIARQPEVDTVVIAASWVGFMNRGDYYRPGDPDETPLDLESPQARWVFDGFAAELAALVASGKRVAIVTSSPRGAALDPRSMIHRADLTLELRGELKPLPRSELASVTEPIDARLRQIAASVGASVIDPTRWLCDARACPGADERGRPLYKDDSHLRASVARERFSGIDPYLYAR